MIDALAIMRGPAPSYIPTGGVSMSLITIQDAQGWAATGKLTLGSLDESLLDQIEAEVLGRIAATYDVSTWLTTTTTPRLVRVAIAKMYVAFMYRKVYSEDEDGSPSFAYQLQLNAEMLIKGIIDTTITLPGISPSSSSAGQPGFYPTDLSSSLCAGEWGDNSLGDAKFSMGKVF